MILPEMNILAYRDSLPQGSTPTTTDIQGSNLAGLIIGLVTVVTGIIGLFIKGWTVWKNRRGVVWEPPVTEQLPDTASTMPLDIQPDLDNTARQEIEVPSRVAQTIHTNNYHISIYTHAGGINHVDGINREQQQRRERGMSEIEGLRPPAPLNRVFTV